MAIQNLSEAKRSGQWTPTVTPVSNVDAATVVAATYCITGDTVQCFVRLSVDQTATGQASVEITLPIGIDVISVGDIIGVCGGGTLGYGGQVSGSVANNTAVLGFDNASASELPTVAVFAYRIIR